MQYVLKKTELAKLISGIRTAIAVPFIDDVEDYVVEAILEYAKSIVGPDPYFNIRSKKLYDVVDSKKKIGWSVKSLQWQFYDECEFELVVQRADVFKKAHELGFGRLDLDSDPNDIGKALLKHWKLKVEGDAKAQGVVSKRVMILLKKNDRKHYAVFEEDIKILAPRAVQWTWTNDSRNGLQGIRKSDGVCVYRWYPSQKQFFERFRLSSDTQKFTIEPVRLEKDQVVEILLPHLKGPRFRRAH